MASFERRYDYVHDPRWIGGTARFFTIQYQLVYRGPRHCWRGGIFGSDNQSPNGQKEVDHVLVRIKRGGKIVRIQVGYRSGRDVWATLLGRSASANDLAARPWTGYYDQFRDQ